jgi:hypothetical protein
MRDRGVSSEANLDCNGNASRTGNEQNAQYKHNDRASPSSCGKRGGTGLNHEANDHHNIIDINSKREILIK